MTNSRLLSFTSMSHVRKASLLIFWCVAPVLPARTLFAQSAPPAWRLPHVGKCEQAGDATVGKREDTALSVIGRSLRAMDSAGKANGWRRSSFAISVRKERDGSNPVGTIELVQSTADPTPGEGDQHPLTIKNKAADSSLAAAALLYRATRGEVAHGRALMMPLLALREALRHKNVDIYLPDHMNVPRQATATTEIIVVVPSKVSGRLLTEHWFFDRSTDLPRAVSYALPIEKLPGVCTYDYREYLDYSQTNGMIVPQTVLGTVGGSEIIRFSLTSLSGQEGR